MAGAGAGVVKKKNGIKLKLSTKKKHKYSPQSITKQGPCTPLSISNESSSTTLKTTTATIDTNENDNDTSSLPPFSLPCDTLLTIRSIIQRGSAAVLQPKNQRHNNVYYPFVLQKMIQHSMTSTVVTADAAETDALLRDSGVNVLEELEELKNDNIIRTLYLDGDDVGVMETQTYVQAVWDAMNDDQRKDGDDTGVEIVNDFIKGLKIWTKIAVDENALKSIFAPQRLSLSIDYLVKQGFLRPKHSLHEHAVPTYYFSLPTLGKCLKEIQKGRFGILRRLKMSYRKELSREVLERGKYSEMTGAFHVRDLITRGVVRLFDTPSRQAFIKLYS